MRLRVTYGSFADFVADHGAQLARGGLFVRVDPGAGVELYAPATVELLLPDATRVVLEGRVVQHAPGVGVAIAFDGSPAPRLAPLLARAGDAPATSEPVATRHEIASPEAAAASSPPAGAASPSSAPRAKPAAGPIPPEATIPERIQLAQHGNRDQRAAILRDINKTLHAHVLRNPGLQLDEVVGIAKMATVSAELLAALAARREWSSRPEIANALARNPKLDMLIAARMVDHVTPEQLRMLAKDPNVRQPVAAAARKKLLK